MKLKIVLALLFILPFNILGQEVTLESEEMTSEQKGVAWLESEMIKLENVYSKAAAQHQKNMSGLNPYSFSLNADKDYLLQRKKDIEAALYSIQENNLKETLREIDILRKTLGEKGSYNSSLHGNINKLNENLKKINNHLAGLQKKEGEENTEKIKEEIEVAKFDNEISKLDDEIASLDALLANSKVEKTKKTKSLDDFLKESGRTTNVKKKSSNNLDDLLAGGSNSKKTTSNNLDDLLSGGNTKSKAKKNNLDDLLGSVEDDTDFKIDYKNGLTGVINSKGKVLIPYKKWDVEEFKMGIAKVRKELETKYCYGSYTAYKSGFVDNRGEFIDGFEIYFLEYENVGVQTLYIKAIVEYDTEAERLVAEARGREYRRKKAREKKEKEIEKKKCKIEINNWKNNIKSRYI